MGGELRVSTLGDLSKEITYGYTESASFEKIGPHFLRITDIQNGTVDWNTVPHCRIDKNNLSKYLLKKGDIVVARTGNSTGENYLFNSSKEAIFASYLIRFKIDPNLANPFYIWYTMRSPKWWSFVASSKTGSAQAGANAKVLSKYPITIHPISVQQNIAHILGSLDDKIELNRQTNQTLEAMAQALFKSWFVDFDPVIDNALAAGNEIPDALQDRADTRKALGDKRKALPEDVRGVFPDAFVFTEELGWIPEGWEALKLSALLEIKYGKDHKKLCVGNIPVYGSGGLMRKANLALYEGESVLIPRKGTLSNILYVNEAFWTVDTMFYTIPRHKNVAKYAFYHLKSLDFKAMNVGSAVPSMTTKILNELQILLPDKGTLKEFNNILKSYFNKILTNTNQNSTLTNHRDTLLPKLISGELRIPDAEKLVEELK